MKLPTITNRGKYAAVAVVAVAALAAVTIYVTGLAGSPPPPAGTLITVNGIPVSVAEYNDLMNVGLLSASFREESLEWSRQQADEMRDSTIYESHLEWVALGERYGIETPSLSELIMEYARYSQALKAGVAIDEDAIATMINGSKAAFVEFAKSQEGNADTELDTSERFAIAEYNYYVMTYGEDRYWNEILPNKYRRRWGVFAWQDSEVSDRIARGVQAKNDRGIYVYDLELETLDNAKVEVVDASALGMATVEAAKAHARESLSLTHDTK